MRRVLVDAGAFVALASIGHAELLRGIDGRVEMPAVVQVEVADGPAAGILERAVGREPRWIRTGDDPVPEDVALAAELLGRTDSRRPFDGGVELLASALGADDPVVVTDERPLRRTCRALGVPVSGSIGVAVSAVERGELDRDAAREAVVAMDEVGPRLTARTLGTAERLIERAVVARG